MLIQKKDFIEIKFTGKTKEGEIFDSNIEEDLKKINPELKATPLIICIGEGMFLKGVEEFLIGKDVGDYEIPLSSENAFGKRNVKLIQRIPLRIFHEQKLNPIPGIIFNFDGRLAKILTISGGRVIVDFNNPVAGKDVVYHLKVIRKIEDLKEKIKAFNKFLFKKEFKVELTEKKILMDVEKPLVKFVELFKEKFKELFGLEIEVREIEQEKEKLLNDASIKK